MDSTPHKPVEGQPNRAADPASPGRAPEEASKHWPISMSVTAAFSDGDGASVTCTVTFAGPVDISSTPEQPRQRAA